MKKFEDIDKNFKIKQDYKKDRCCLKIFPFFKQHLFEY